MVQKTTGGCRDQGTPFVSCSCGNEVVKEAAGALYEPKLVTVCHRQCIRHYNVLQRVFLPNLITLVDALQNVRTAVFGFISQVVF